jgi:UDP-N-acetylmuramoyl-L-alanyl-D-glutamate--2,6-diaminopimelate ligase
MILEIETADWRIEVQTELVGTFNAENVLAAAAAAWGLGVDAESIASGIRRARRPAGRLERVRVAGGEMLPACIVDYAHTPHAMETVLAMLRRLVRGRLITVFGCGGNRDRAKRPEMGRIAATLSDYVVVTTDNSRYENPGSIVREILEGIPNYCRNFDVIYSRRRAIACAIGQAVGPEDCVAVLGKGHERGQIEGGTTFPFDDREVVMEWLQRRAGRQRKVA